MNSRGALLVSLARQESILENETKKIKENEETKGKGQKVISENEGGEFVRDSSICYDKEKNIQDWINTLSIEVPTKNIGNAVNIISNIVVKEGTLATNDAEFNTENKKNCYSAEMSLSLVSPSVLTDHADQLWQFSDVDDSVADPNYEPSSDEKSFEIVKQEDISYKETCDDTSSDSSSEKISDFLANRNNLEQNSEKGTSRNNPVEILKEVGVECAGHRNYKDRRDFCMFCEKDVSHFARHVSTWHSSEIDVARILSIGDKTKRRVEYSNLRKRGNFIHNRTDIKLRPVKRLSASGRVTATTEDFLPCKHCLGFYKKNSLYRHSKKCSQNSKTNTGKRQCAQSDGQTTLLLGNFFKYDKLLDTDLFPHMRADNISLVAKKDPLICKYAYSYMKGRRTKGNLDFVRQNVRRMAKLLEFARARDSNIKHFMDLLRPRYFRMIIDGVNELARYNNETEKYESPTLAMNFGTLLKKSCDLAFIELIQNPNTIERREDVNILKNLIISQWADEVSAEASTNLNENKWNKEELLPLTSDLKKINEHLFTSAEQLYNKLVKDDNDLQAYYSLKDVLYCQIILLNRRRPGEVAQMKVQTYKSINLDHSTQNTEFENCLTQTEKILLQTFSRFVIKGKRGRGVPVLLSPTMRQHFELLITLRDKFLTTDNVYIFHTKGKSFIDGTKTLQKYVKKCNITCAKSITATLLRKHLATITQLLQFSNNDMEQLSKFMGHTLKTHCNVYRMSDNIYQTAKVSKLLLLMMEGGAENFKGKQLDEIDIDLNPVEANLFEELLQVPQIDEIDNSVPVKEVNKNVKNAVKRESWSVEQKRIISKYFAQHVQRKEAPKHNEVNKFMELHPELFKERKWTSIKAVVYNIYTGKLKVK